MDQINIGCNGLIIKDNQLLLGKRKNCYGAGLYGLPGGHLEYAEKITDAVKRELKEECGIEVTELRYNSTIDQLRPDQHYIQVNFVITQFSGTIQNIELERCEGWEWFDLNNLPQNIFVAHMPIIQAYLNQYSFSD